MSKLFLNDNARNHIRFFPMNDVFTDIPEGEGAKIEWCEQKFNELKTSSDAKLLVKYSHKTRGYLISVWEMNNRYYLIQCLRNEFKTFNNNIYISKDKEDMLSIAKFLQQNIETIMSDYKQQIFDARDYLINERKEHSK